MAISKEEVKQKITELIEKYQRHKNEGKFKTYNEENTKQWIDELFRILGWDILEDIAKEYGTGKRKRVDYAFKIDGTIKFLLEAKGYNEELEEKYIQQTLEYGYQNNKTWVILTNFREIRVYNAKYFDKEEHIRRLYEPIRIEDLITRIDDVWILSKDGMRQNLINDLAKKYGKIKPKAPIDTLIFEDLLRWRKMLEKAIIAAPEQNHIPINPIDAEKYVDECVQKILDRIIFVRVCEDRGLEDEEQLRWCIKKWKEDKKIPLSNFVNREFSKKDGEYNSGLFHAHPSQNLTIDSQILEQIIEESYVNPEKLTYDFSAIDADILGTIYENYLGYIQKKVWDKEEKQKSKRKAHGIYYTPTYIVDYIVKNTLGKKLKECKTPEDALKIKVVDPACGSGSFLIRAFDEFRNWYINYARNKGEKQQTLGSEIKGTVEFMSKVLQNCIYGVDLDSKAVELAQLNLLLKAAEGKHKLPTLSYTIRCGNSLIDDNAVAGEKAFKWKESFSEVFKNDGFDIVIGNPPYGAELNEAERDFLEVKFKLRNTDTACLFIGLAKALLNKKGINGFIIPKPFVYSSSWKISRELILQGLREIVDCGKVWEDVKLEQVIYFYENLGQNEEYISCIRKEQEILSVGSINKSTVNEFGFFLNGITAEELTLGRKIMVNGNPLNEFVINQRGAIYQKEITEIESDFKVLGGAQIGRYIIYDDIKGYIAKKIVTDMKAQIKENSILVQRIVAHITKPTDHIKITASLFNETNSSEYIIVDTINQLQNKGIESSEFLIAILNSKLINWYAYRFIFGKAIRTMQFDNPVTEKIPIPKEINKKIKLDLISITKKMISLSKRFSQLSHQNSNEAQSLKMEIEKTDAEIDQLVYELYGLSEEEIKIVEGSLKV